jgi:hypothetical protein
MPRLSIMPDPRLMSSASCTDILLDHLRAFLAGEETIHEYFCRQSESPLTRHSSLFERYGVVDTVRIMTDRETGRPRGFGFVEMSDDTAARAAITGLQGAALGGRTLNVNEARPREERPRPRRERW